MKKCIAVLLCICALSVTALAAVDDNAIYDEYVTLYGEPPSIDDYPPGDGYFMAYNAWVSGLDVYRKQRAEEISRTAAEEAAQEAAEEEVPVTPPKTTESAGSNHAVPSSPSYTSADMGADDKYPVGSYVDPAGNVYSPSGTLLSPGTTPASPPAVESTPSAQVLEDPDEEAVTPPTWYVEDLRSLDPPVEILTGLKSLVTSIFGEYTPVTTTSVISETVGSDTHQYLVETVAPGAAGVDYEWIAGVALFGLLLFCFMKLLGGILK